MFKLTKKAAGWLVVTAVLISTLACQRSGPQGGEQNTLLPATQVQPAGQESTAAPAPTTASASTQQPTQAAATQPSAASLSPTPTPAPAGAGLSQQLQAQGDELENKLHQLDQMNQSADKLEDVP
jgi:hypothetical protein